MAEDVLPERLVIPTRDELIRKYERDYSIRAPGAKTGEGTLVRIDATLLTDMVYPLYAEADRFAAIVDEDRMTPDQLLVEAQKIGLDPPTFLPEVGSSGFVAARTSTGGGTIYAGDELTDPQSGKRFQCAATALYLDGGQVPVTAKDTGPDTNIPAGTILRWTSPRPGVGPEATVEAQFDGSGLTGGRLQETPAELVDRIRRRKRNPIASGNAAEYIEAIEKTPGVPVQKAFAIPCIDGPGTTALCFTVRPSSSGGTRVPNNTQIAKVTENLAGKFPADDSAFVCTIVEEPTTIALEVEWTKASNGWVDAVPWPPGDATDQPAVTGTISWISIELTVGNLSFPDPVAGQTIAFWNPTTKKFAKKRILSVVANTVGPNRVYSIFVDTSNNASDLDFIPATGAKASPYTALLDTLTPPLLDYFDQLGPGEQVVSFDAGLRQRRQPESPENWPNEITNRAIELLLRFRSIKSVEIVSPDLPHPTPVGTPMVASKLLKLSDFVVYPR